MLLESPRDHGPCETFSLRLGIPHPAQGQPETAPVTSGLGIRGNDREQTYGIEEAGGDTVMVATGLRAVGDGSETREEWSSTVIASTK